MPIDVVAESEHHDPDIYIHKPDLETQERDHKSLNTTLRSLKSNSTIEKLCKSFIPNILSSPSIQNTWLRILLPLIIRVASAR